ncbi:MAG: DUF3179 domain-containing (seleno)protein [Cyclobacteriaceae bacterium]
MSKTAFVLLIIVVIGCQPSEKKVASAESDQNVTPQAQRPIAYENGKIFEKNGRKYLWGGEDSTWHFDITNSPLKDQQYHYGIGRERFHALTAPEFLSLEEADMIYPDSARFLLLKIGDDTRAYGIDLLTHHEVVNDVVDGKPIMAAYCILADLGAIYDRRLIDGREFTFALSGYTYYDPEVWDGMDGFVLWDRETESTWWPLIGKAVSGPLQNTAMKVYDETNWAQTTWGAIKSKHSKLKVLKPGQTMQPPTNWRRYDDLGINQEANENYDEVAPRSGENTSSN